MAINQLNTGTGGGDTFIKASGNNLTDLNTNFPPSTLTIGDIGKVLYGENEFTSSKVIFWTEPKYEFPPGLYVIKNDIDVDPSNNFWGFWQTQSINSLKTVIFDVTTDWTSLFNANPSFQADSLINYQGVRYVNISGSFSVTTPDLDTTNWSSHIDLNEQASTAYKEGRIFYEGKTLRFYNDKPDLIMQLGRTLSSRYRNDTGGFVGKGKVLYIKEVPTPGVISCQLASASSYNENWVVGVAATDSNDGELFEFMLKGFIPGVDTSTWDYSVPLYLSATPGEIVDERPLYPAKPIVIGTVGVQSVSGVLGVNVGRDDYQSQFDGCVVEKQDYTIVVEGTQVFCDVEKVGGGDLPVQLQSMTRLLNCTTGTGVGGKARVELLQGTATVEQSSLVYVDLDPSGDARLQVTSGYPATSSFAIIGTIIIGDYTTVTNEGVWADRRTTSAIYHDGNGQQQHLIERWAVESPKWYTGCNPTATIDTGPTPDVLDLSMAAGEAYQTHKHDVPAMSVSVNGIYVANGPGGSSLERFTKVNNLHSVLGYTSNSSESRDTTARGSIVIFATVSRETSECKLYVNLPNDLYGTGGQQEDNCYYDLNNTADYTVPESLRYTAFLVARIPYLLQNNDVSFSNPTGTNEILNLLGLPIGISGGASGTSAFVPNLTQVLTQGNDAGNHQMKNVSDPTDPQDATTMSYVDAKSLQDAYDNLAQVYQTILNNTTGSMSIQAGAGYTGNFLELFNSAGVLKAYFDNDSILAINELKESITNAGVNIENVLLRDSSAFMDYLDIYQSMRASIIEEYTGNTGVTIDGTLLKDGGFVAPNGGVIGDGDPSNGTGLEVIGNVSGGVVAEFNYPGTGLGGITASGYPDGSKRAAFYNIDDNTIRISKDNGTIVGYTHFTAQGNLLLGQGGLPSDNLTDKIQCLGSSANSTGVWAVLSDERVKQEITLVSDPLQKVLDIAECVRHFRYIPEAGMGNEIRTQFIAQLLIAKGFGGHIKNVTPHNEFIGRKLKWVYKDESYTEEVPKTKIVKVTKKCIENHCIVESLVDEEITVMKETTVEEIKTIDGEDKIVSVKKQVPVMEKITKTRRVVKKEGEKLYQIENNFDPYVFPAIKVLKEENDGLKLEIETLNKSNIQLKEEIRLIKEYLGIEEK